MDKKEIRELAGRVINTSASNQRFTISTMPGAAPRRYNLKPFEQVDLAPGYCIRVQTAEGREARPSIVEQLTKGAVVPVIYEEGQAALKLAAAQAAAPVAPAASDVVLVGPGSAPVAPSQLPSLDAEIEDKKGSAKRK